MYEWLKEQIAEVNTPKFFVVDGPPDASLRAAIEQEQMGLPHSYKAFVLEFGNAKLYRQHAGYGLGVKGAPVEAQTREGEALFRIGSFHERNAFFRRADVGRGAEAPVLESGPGGLVEVSPSFEEWLRQRADSLRGSIGKRAWAQLVAVPAPFSSEELAIVEARRAYEWRMVGVAPNGDIQIEVTNNSTTSLPFLSIGVRDSGGTFSGGLWIGVRDLRPGQTAIYERDCYKKHLSRDEVVLFPLPDPGPEDRDSYWEFRSQSGR